MIRAVFRCVVAGMVCAAAAIAAKADAYHAKPKLVIVLVLDQFRGDYLDRYRDDFKSTNGFNLFLKRGAYFPECYYDYANTHTAPGHATIGTGAYTDGHGIQSNQWWDFSRSTKHVYSSVEDDAYQLVGVPQGTPITPGASPRSELASTLGDEVVLATRGEGKVFGVSLKDRAAILTSGHASTAAFWVDQKSGVFISSTYWMKELPGWVSKFNESGRAQAAVKEAGVASGRFYDAVGATVTGVNYELDFAETLIDGEQLGKHAGTDVLTVSISSTDILGHQVGPDAQAQRALIDGTDVALDKFFTWVNTHVDGGLANVWVAMSADHGVAPTVETARKLGMPARSFNPGRLNDAVNEELAKKYKVPDETKFILPGAELDYIALDSRVFERLGVSESDAEATVAAALPVGAQRLNSDPAVPPVLVRKVYTKAQMAAGLAPATDAGRRVLHSYSPNGGWNVLVEFGMYEVPGRDTGATHLTSYSYDRHVPLAFFGSAFVPGTYLDLVQPVDLAVTLAALLKVNQPSAAAGHVLTQAIRPEFDGACSEVPKRGNIPSPCFGAKSSKR